MPENNWETHTLEIDGENIEFERNNHTGVTRYPGVVECSTYSVEDAKELARSLFGKKAEQ